jgi:hypothetical protein
MSCWYVFFAYLSAPHWRTRYTMTLDVGGSAVPDTDEHQLSNISLRWMVREVMKSQCGIRFDEHALSRASIPKFNSSGRPTDTDGEKALDSADAFEPIYDQLVLNWMWWILEIVPLSSSWQDKKGDWHTEWRCVQSCRIFGRILFLKRIGFIVATLGEAAGFQVESRCFIPPSSNGLLIPS